MVFLLDALAAAHVLGYAAGEGELAELERVGTIAGGFAGGDELVGGGHGVVDDGGQFEQHVLLHGVHLGPVLDVGAVAELGVELLVLVAVVYAALVDLGVKLVGLVAVGVVDVGSGGDDSPVGGGGGDGAGVHEGDEAELALAGLGAFAVGGSCGWCGGC